MLPKIHKSVENPTGRPVISRSGRRTEPVSKYRDYFIKPFVSSLPDI